MEKTTLPLFEWLNSQRYDLLTIEQLVWKWDNLTCFNNQLYLLKQFITTTETKQDLSFEDWIIVKFHPNMYHLNIPELARLWSKYNES